MSLTSFYLTSNLYKLLVGNASETDINTGGDGDNIANNAKDEGNYIKILIT